MAHSLFKAKQYLKNKGLKATFLLKCLINGQNLLHEVALSLLRKLIIPIGTYGSEMRGAFCNSDLYKTADNLLYIIFMTQGHLQGQKVNFYDK